MIESPARSYEVHKKQATLHAPLLLPTTVVHNVSRPEAPLLQKIFTWGRLLYGYVISQRGTRYLCV